MKKFFGHPEMRCASVWAFLIYIRSAGCFFALLRTFLRSGAYGTRFSDPVCGSYRRKLLCLWICASFTADFDAKQAIYVILYKSDVHNTRYFLCEFGKSVRQTPLTKSKIQVLQVTEVNFRSQRSTLYFTEIWGVWRVYSYIKQVGNYLCIEEVRT